MSCRLDIGERISHRTLRAGFFWELIELARKRVPQWSERLFVGNAIDWGPHRRYDFVRTGLEYVPPRRQADLIRRLLEHVVIPGGRRIIGIFNEPTTRGQDRAGEVSTEQLIMSWGFRFSGRSEHPHFRGPSLVYRVVWIDN